MLILYRWIWIWQTDMNKENLDTQIAREIEIERKRFALLPENYQKILRPLAKLP